MKKIKTVESFIQCFFDENIEHLKLNYPGINPNKLIDVYCQFFSTSAQEAMTLDERNSFFMRIREGEPLEYILEEKFFFNSPFYVNPDVLIPRNETEILVEKSLELISKKGWKSFADIGVGSGCISLSLLTESIKPLKGVAVDIDENALEVCEINRRRLKSKMPQSSSLKLLLGDRLDPLKESVDFIVTNPPYIDDDLGKEGVHHQTDTYEPKLALYLPAESYELWFEKFFRDSFEKITDGGALLMEGHEDKLERLREMALTVFGSAEIIQDYTGANRFLFAYKD